MKTEARVISATNKNLEDLVRSGAFREDFYYRIHVFPIEVPPLRMRVEDIPILVDYFIASFAESSGKPIEGIARDALDQMLLYPWPGNVRELENAIQHAFVTAQGDRIMLMDLPPEVRGLRPSLAAAAEPSLRPEQLAERERIVQALREAGGNRTKAAERLGTSRVTLWKKIAQLSIDVELISR